MNSFEDLVKITFENRFEIGLCRSGLVSSEKLVRLVVICTISSARQAYLNALLLLFFGWKSCGVESCGCVILVDESYGISSAASAALHIFVMLWYGKAVSNGVRAASLPNVDFQLRGRSPMS